MNHLWRSAPSGIQELLDAVNADRAEPISRPTLQTQLARLEGKGWVKRDSTSRSHLYEPAIAEAFGRKSVLSDLKRRFFGGSILTLVRCLVESGDISAAELAELRELVAESQKKKGNPS